MYPFVKIKKSAFFISTKPQKNLKNQIVKYLNNFGGTYLTKTIIKASLF